MKVVNTLINSNFDSNNTKISQTHCWAIKQKRKKLYENIICVREITHNTYRLEKHTNRKKPIVSLFTATQVVYIKKCKLCTG